MATRALIGIELRDGRIFTSYHHWDGYPSGLGYNLVSNWNDPGKLEQAIALGDASHWGVRATPESVEHSFDTPESGTNVYYKRDRGEEGDLGPVTFNSVGEIMDNWRDHGVSYVYILKTDGTWTMLNGDGAVFDAQQKIVDAFNEAHTEGV